MTDADALVVFDFGAGSTMLSNTNSQLAAVAQRWPEVPVLAQTEAATALARQGRLVVDIEAEARTQFGLSSGDYVDTWHVAQACGRLIRQAGWHTVGLVAHPAHYARCAATLQSAGLAVVGPVIDMDAVGFDPRSTQWWTRNRTLWVLRELAVVTHHLFSGRLKRR